MTPDDAARVPSPVLRAVVAPPTEAELAGAELAGAMFLREYSRPGVVQGLRLVSRTGMSVAIGAAVLSMTGVTAAAAYSGALPRAMQIVTHRLVGHASARHAHRETPDRAPRRVDAAPTATPGAIRVGAPLVARVVVPGASVRVDLVLTGAPPAEATAALQERDPGRAAWREFAHVPLATAGTATAVLRVPHSLLLRWVLTGVSGHDLAGPEARVQARPALRMVLPGSWREGTPSEVALTSVPTQRGRPALVQRLAGRRWVTVAHVVLGPAGTAVLHVTLTSHGRVTLRALLPGDALYACAQSRPAAVLVA